MTIPKRPSQHPPSVPPPARVGAGTSVRPADVRDALTEAAARAGGSLSQSTRPSVAPTSMRKTIMIVDDDATIRAKLKEGLEPFYDVLVAKDGMEAVEMCSTILPPAMIIADVVMPRVDGFTMAKILRGHPTMKRVQIIFYSTRDTPQDVRQALVLGVVQYVTKRTSVPELVSKIRKLVV